MRSERLGRSRRIPASVATREGADAIIATALDHYGGVDI